MADNTQDASQQPAPAAPQPQPAHGHVPVNVGEYLHGQGLTLAHVGYDDDEGGVKITAKDNAGNLFNLTEDSLKQGLVKQGYITPESTVGFTPNSYNTADSALNEVPTGLSYMDAERVAWSSDKGAAQTLIDKYGKDKVSLTDDNKAIAVQDPDGVWRKIAPDFHDDQGSWNWGNFVYNMQRHQKDFAEVGAFAAGAEVANPAIMEALGGSGLPSSVAAGVAQAGASVAGGLGADTANIVMGRVLGTTGESPTDTAKTMALHALINAAVPGAADMVTEKAVLPLLKGTLNKLGDLPSGMISGISRVMSMFGDGNATAVEHSITHAGPVSAAMDEIEANASSMIDDARSQGASLNSHDAVQQASADMVTKSGQAFSGDVEDAGKMTRNLNNWMNSKASELVNSLDEDTKGALQEKIPVQAVQASNSFRNALGAAGVPVNAAGRVTANDLSASFGTMTPEEASSAAKAMNTGLSTLEKLSQFDVTDPSAFKDMASMQATVESMKKALGNSAMSPQAIQEAGKHLDNVATIMSNGLPVNFRNQYANLMKQYANAAHATNYVLGSALSAGSSDTMAAAGGRVADLLTKQQAGDKAAGAMWNSLMDITPNSGQLRTDLQTSLSARYMYAYSSAPTSTLGGAYARLGAMAVRPALKSTVMGLGSAANAADRMLDAAGINRQMANAATQKALSSGAGAALKASLAQMQNPSDFTDQGKVKQLMQSYLGYKSTSQDQDMQRH